MLGALWAFVPLPYRVLGVATCAAALAGGGFVVGARHADQTARIAALETAHKSDLSFINMQADQIKTRDATVQRLNDVSEQAAKRADDLEAQSKQITDQLDAFTNFIGPPGPCGLSRADVDRLRAIGARTNSPPAPVPRPPSPAAPAP
jgi:ABC-type uncharacterized transport system fused permease/ATPase subunit